MRQYLAGRRTFFVTSAVDGSGNESVFSKVKERRRSLTLKKTLSFPLPSTAEVTKKYVCPLSTVRIRICQQRNQGAVQFRVWASADRSPGNTL